MAVELATAYISLVASAKGIAASVEKAVGGAAEKAAKDTGASIDRILSRAVDRMRLSVPSVEIPDLADIPAPDIGVPVIPPPAPLNLADIRAPRIGQPEIPQPDLPRLPTLRAPDVAQPEIPEPDTSRFLSGAQKAGVAAGAAAAAGLGVGFLSATSAEVSNDRLAAQLGIANPAFAADLGKIAGAVYVANFGESLGQVNQAVRGVLQQGLVPEDATNSAISRVTEKVLGLADVFDQDLGVTTAGIAQVLKTGLAANADEAIDVIVRGFQQGADKSGDLLDSLNEYGTQFRKLGLSAAKATGILIQGLKAGARDSDVVADAIKEFSILAVNGTEATAEAFRSLGLDAAAMAAQIGRGGPEAAGALDAVLEKLRAMPDPVARAQTAVGLFGTQAEDLGDALLAIDPSKAVARLGDVAGAADRMNKIVGDNTTSAFESFKRAAETKLAGVTGALGPVLSGVLNLAPALGGLSLVAQNLPLGSVAKGILNVGKAALVGTARIVAQTAAFVAQRVATAAAAVAAKAYTAAQWLLNAAMAANPVVLIVAGIVALVAALVLAWKNSERFREIVTAAFDVVADAARAVVGAFSAALDWLRSNWDVVLAILTGPFGAAILLVRRFGDDILGFFKALPGRIAAVAGDLFGFVRTGISGAANWVRDRIGDVVGFFTGLPERFRAAAGNMFGWIVDLFKGAINSVLNIWNNLKFPSFEIGGWDPPGPIPKLPSFRTPEINFPNIPLLKLHQGGIVPGQAGQDVLAILQAGERVIPAAEVPGGRQRTGFSLEGGIHVTTPREERVATDVVRELRSLAFLLGG